MIDCFEEDSTFEDSILSYLSWLVWVTFRDCDFCIIKLNWYLMFLKFDYTLHYFMAFKQIKHLSIK